MFKSNPTDLNDRDSEYRKHISQEIVQSTRLVTMLGVVMFMLFYLADKWAFSSNHDSLLYMRLGVCSILGLTFLATFNTKFSEKIHAIILPIPYIVASAAVSYMIYLASPGDYASQVYFAGLMLIIMMMFGWSFLNLLTTLAISAFIFSSYSYVKLSSVIQIDQSTIVELVINLSFLISAAIIGFISQLIRDRHLRENFMLQVSLKQAYNQKSVEAKDNAYLANHDPLTDLPNRRYMTELLEESLIYARDNNKILLIMFVDLNGFKQVNDVYGHNAGDQVLVIAGKRLELAIRQGDHLSRLGGDEYLMGLMMDKESISEIEPMTKKFVDIISQSMNVDGLRIKVSASIGVAAYPIHGNNVESLIEIADKRMYKEKKGLHGMSFNFDSTNDEKLLAFPANANSELL